MPESFLKVVLVCGVFFLLVFPFQVLAFQYLDVAINEIAWAGTKEAWYFEWIELINNTEKEIHLSGWKIENAGEKNKALTLEEKIPPQSLFLICKKEQEGCDLKTWNLSLKDNYGENGNLILRDKEGNVVDQTPKASNAKWPGGDKKTKQTMERKNPKIPGNDFQNWQTSQEPNGSPKIKNIVISIKPLESDFIKPREQPEEKIQLKSYPSGIVINELLPSPEGKDESEEWIEFFNENFFEVDLSLWKIQDTEGSTKIYTFPEGTIIKTRGFLILRRPETKIILNNKGDGLKIVQPDGKVADEIYYERAPTGKSFGKIGKDWAWNSNLTPGAENLILQIKKENNLEQIANKELTGALSQTLPKKFSDTKVSENFRFVLPLALIFSLLSGILIFVLKKKVKDSP